MFGPLLFLSFFALLLCFPFGNLKKRLPLYPLLLLLGIFSLILGNFADSNESLVKLFFTSGILTSGTAELYLISGLYFSLIVNQWNRIFAHSKSIFPSVDLIKLFSTLLICYLGITASNLNLAMVALMALTLLLNPRAERILIFLIFFLEIIGFLVISWIGINFQIFTFAQIDYMHFTVQLLCGLFFLVYALVWSLVVLSKREGSFFPLVVGKMTIVEFCLLKMTAAESLPIAVSLIIIALLVVLYFVIARPQLSITKTTFLILSLIILLPIFTDGAGNYVLAKTTLLILIPAFQIIEHNLYDFLSKKIGADHNVGMKMSAIGLLLVLLAFPISPFFIFYFELFNKLAALGSGVLVGGISLFLLIFSILMSGIWFRPQWDSRIMLKDAPQNSMLEKDKIQLALIFSLMVMLFMVFILRNELYKTNFLQPADGQKLNQGFISYGYSNLYALFIFIPIIGFLIIYFYGDQISWIQKNCKDYFERYQKYTTNWLFLFLLFIVDLLNKVKVIIFILLKCFKYFLNKISEFFLSSPVMRAETMEFQRVEILIGQLVLLLIGLFLFIGY